MTMTTTPTTAETVRNARAMAAMLRLSVAAIETPIMQERAAANPGTVLTRSEYNQAQAALAAITKAAHESLGRHVLGGAIVWAYDRAEGDEKAVLDGLMTAELPSPEWIGSAMMPVLLGERPEFAGRGDEAIAQAMVACASRAIPAWDAVRNTEVA